ncbi:hypothetical protein E0Z10_g6867 [Xylaria hypoxylon]|uniref:Uncharacterized protein n=1 Tax=Xylaria hypoxylon TaxID=37992 RepID=A0A4Z0YWP9_9PEZI|nr:hypothetical protein E0Z10_g6867 [Xylaria hypoxylon]
MMGAKDYAGPSLQPVYTAYRNLSQDVVIALAQREDFGGITAYMWGRILTKMDLVTGLARSLVTVPARNRTTDRMEDREIGYGKWIAKYYGPPSQNYPALSREMPVLAPESIARNVPRDQDGGGPDGGDYSDGDDNDNNDGGGGDGGNGGNNDNNNDNDGGGDDGGNGGNGDNDDSTFVDYWDDPRFDGPNTEGNTEGAESSSDDSDSDGEGGAGGERSGVPGGGGAGHHRHNGRDGSWAAVCKRCIHISSEEMCHMCGGEVLPVYKPIKGRNKRMRAMLAHENDDSIDSPNKRVQSLLSSQAIIDNLTDQLRKARLNLREGPGTSMATIHFDHPDSSRQRGPEFEDFSRKENRL